MSSSSLLDGPVQRHVLLLKLQREMDVRPSFDEGYDNDPGGEIQAWIARVGALMARVGIEQKTQFNATRQTLAQYWYHVIRNLQIEVRRTIEELNLELELQSGDSLGEVYAAGEEYRFFRDVCDAISASELEVFLIDPYLDASIFSKMFEAGVSFKIRILCNRYFDSVSEVAEKLQETGPEVDVRKHTGIHDRLLFIDGKVGWIIGASPKDGGRKPTYFLPLPRELIEQKFSIYNEAFAAVKDETT